MRRHHKSMTLVVRPRTQRIEGGTMGVPMTSSLSAALHARILGSVLMMDLMNSSMA
jgi:hypothetical protein